MSHHRRTIPAPALPARAGEDDAVTGEVIDGPVFRIMYPTNVPTSSARIREALGEIGERPATLAEIEAFLARNGFPCDETNRRPIIDVEVIAGTCPFCGQESVYPQAGVPDFCGNCHQFTQCFRCGGTVTVVNGTVVCSDSECESYAASAANDPLFGDLGMDDDFDD